MLIFLSKQQLTQSNNEKYVVGNNFVSIFFLSKHFKNTYNPVYKDAFWHRNGLVSTI